MSGSGSIASDEVRYYWQSLDWPALVRDYPPPPFFGRTTGRLSSDAVWALQDQRFMQRVREAWSVPFYQRRWSATGLEPGDIRSLSDIEKIPTFTSDDLKEAIVSDPPFGDHHPLGRADFSRTLIKIHTSGGTTGLPRVTLFDPLAMEVQGIQAARALYAQQARAGDIIQITYTTAIQNAGWTWLYGAYNWLGATPITAGAGNVTSSERQLEYAQAWGTNSWISRGEYLARLVEVARSMKLDLHALKTRHIHAHLGPDTEGVLRRQLEDAWGAKVYDNYGTHEVGLLAFECEAQDRMHVNEDTAYIQLADVDSGETLPFGTRGNMVVTSLHRSVPPIIRYNLRDLLIAYDREECSCGLCTRKLSTFLGRSDEMVKLRGTNVYPMACQNAVVKDQRTTGEFICVARSTGEGLMRREEMIVRVERRTTDIDAQVLADDLREALHKDLGVRVDVEIVDVDALAEFTGLGRQSKVRRLLDLRKK